MFCKHCGNQLNETDAFCNRCGNPQAESHDIMQSSMQKNDCEISKAEKIARIINILFFIFAYCVSLITFIYIAAEEGGVSPSVFPAIVILVLTILLHLFVFKKKQIKRIKNKFKKKPKLSNIFVSVIYIVLPLILFFGSFEYSYYVTIGNSQAVAMRYMKRTLKENLKNPESLQIHDITYKGQNQIEDDNYRYYNIVIEYSAQNGFGGYTRDSIEKHLQVNKSTASVFEISMKEYTDKMIEFFDNRNAKQYSEKLSSISENIPFDLLCTRTLNYDSVYDFLKDNEFELDVTHFKGGEQKGAIEIATNTTFDKFEGELSFYFEKDNQQLRRIEFLWCPDIVFYDEELGSKRLGEGQTADIKDINRISTDISKILQVNYTDVSGNNNSLYDNSYMWQLGDNISVVLEWVQYEKDGVIAVDHIYLKGINEQVE